jgi:hypothetical protein
MGQQLFRQAAWIRRLALLRCLSSHARDLLSIEIQSDNPVNPRALLVTCDSCRFGWVPNPLVEHVLTRGCVSNSRTRQPRHARPPSSAARQIGGTHQALGVGFIMGCLGNQRMCDYVGLLGSWRFRVGGRRSLATRRDSELASVTESVDDGFFQLNCAPDSAAQTSTEPPAMSTMTPVIQFESSDARNSAALATSSGVPSRRSGCDWASER